MLPKGRSSSAHQAAQPRGRSPYDRGETLPEGPQTFRTSGGAAAKENGVAEDNFIWHSILKRYYEHLRRLRESEG